LDETSESVVVQDKTAVAVAVKQTVGSAAVIVTWESTAVNAMGTWQIRHPLLNCNDPSKPILGRLSSLRPRLIK
jgi:hypothetical protein